MIETTGKVAFSIKDRIVIADPRYIDEDDTLEGLAKYDLGVVLDGCAGFWEAEVEFKGGRTSVLRAVKYGETVFDSRWELVNKDNGVDSGQMFIGCTSTLPLTYEDVLDHYRPYGRGGEWVDKDFFGHGEGAISATGYGDGSYPVYVQRVNGNPVAIEVRFQEDEDEGWGNEDEEDEGEDN